MKIAHVVLPRIRLADGGVVRAAIDFSEAALAAGHDVRLFTRQSDMDGVPTWVQNRTVTRRLGISRQVVAWKPDVVHLHCIWCAGTAEVAAVCRLRGVPYVLSAHGMLNSWPLSQKRAKKLAHLRLLGRWIIQGAAALHFTAEAEMSQVLNNVGLLEYDGFILTAPYVVNLDPYLDVVPARVATSKWEWMQNYEHILLFLSRLHPKKRPDVVLFAARELISEGYDVGVVMAGSGEPNFEKQMHDLVRIYNIGDRVHFVGHVNNPLKQSLFDASAVFVLPTHQENFGIALIEAACLGVPVVTTTGTDIHRELERAGAVVLRNEGDTESMAQAVKAAVASLLDDPESRAERGARLRTETLRWLDPKACWNEYEDLYQRITGPLKDGPN